MKRACRAILMLLGLLVAVPGFVQGANEKLNQISANKIILTDEYGKGRMVLAVENGCPGIYVLNEKGKTKIFIGLDEGHPRWVMLGPNRSRVAVKMNGAKVDIAVRNQAGSKVAGLSVDNDGVPKIDIMSEDGGDGQIEDHAKEELILQKKALEALVDYAKANKGKEQGSNEELRALIQRLLEINSENTK